MRETRLPSTHYRCVPFCWRQSWDTHVGWGKARCSVHGGCAQVSYWRCHFQGSKAKGAPLWFQNVPESGSSMKSLFPVSLSHSSSPSSLHNEIKDVNRHRTISAVCSTKTQGLLCINYFVFLRQGLDIHPKMFMKSPSFCLSVLRAGIRCVHAQHIDYS